LHNLLLGSNLAQDNKLIRSLIENARRGNNTAFEQLFQINVDFVYALSLRLTADQTLAQDYTKKIFVEAWKNLASIREGVTFASWLTGFTVYYFLSEWHAKRIRDKNDRESVNWLFDYKLDVLIASLPVEERVAVILHDMKKYSMEETADLLGSGIENARTLLRNAHRKLILSL